MTDHWTPDDVADAMRSAAAMTLAGYRRDATAIGELWNGTETKDALVWALSILPGMAVRALLARPDVGIPADATERVLADVVHAIAAVNPDDLEEDA
jgi:hypothetical protein